MESVNIYEFRIDGMHFRLILDFIYSRQANHRELYVIARIDIVHMILLRSEITQPLKNEKEKERTIKTMPKFIKVEKIRRHLNYSVAISSNVTNLMVEQTVQIGPNVICQELSSVYGTVSKKKAKKSRLPNAIA